MLGPLSFLPGGFKMLLVGRLWSSSACVVREGEEEVSSLKAVLPQGWLL